MDLIEIAGQNSMNLADRFASMRSAAPGDHADRLDAFTQRVRKAGQVAINIRPFFLTDILGGSKLQNIYEWANEHASLSGRPVEEILGEKLGKYFPRRLKFDDCFDEGRAFHYGALNIGGIGVDRYGQFCIVLITAFCVADNAVVFLKNDSLETYMPSETQLNEMALREETALHSHRHFLAALKHGSSLPRMNEDEWPNQLCSNNDYIEAIFVADVDLACIGTVRIRESEYRRLFELAFNDYARKHDDATKALAYDFLQILRADRARTIKLERV